MKYSLWNRLNYLRNYVPICLKYAIFGVHEGLTMQGSVSHEEVAIFNWYAIPKYSVRNVRMPDSHKTLYTPVLYVTCS